MSSSISRKMFGVAVLVVLSSCTDGSEIVQPTAEEVVAAHVESGMDQTVADCLVGIGMQEVSGLAMLPDAERTESEAIIVDVLTTSCEEASAFVVEKDPEPERLAFEDGPFTFGDDPIFDQLWEACEAGDGIACNQLWETSPVGSDYEHFGVTCGNRDQILDCSDELTAETVDAIDAALEAKKQADIDRANDATSDVTS